MNKLEREALELAIKHTLSIASQGYTMGDDEGCRESRRLMASADFITGLDTIKQAVRAYVGFVAKAKPSELKRLVQSKGSMWVTDEQYAATRRGRKQ